MKRSRYDLSVKVKGNHGNYTVRRRAVDHSFECTCPAWEEGRLTCHHVREVRDALRDITPPSALETALVEAVREFPYFIPEEDRFIIKLKNVLQSFVED